MYFFFQAEDGIRDRNVTGVQTCALPISGKVFKSPKEFRKSVEANKTTAQPPASKELDIKKADQSQPRPVPRRVKKPTVHVLDKQIGRASCRERVWIREDAGE